MNQLSQFLSELPNYAGIFLLMLSTFLIGYFAAWSLQRSKYLKTLRKMNRKASFTQMAGKEKDIDVIFTEIKPKIMEVVKEAREELDLQKEEEEVEESNNEQLSETKAPEDIARQARTSYITYTKNKPELNFENFGVSNKNDRQDLTKIDGIGPYIEQKLNEIGIYNFDQISRFKDEDIRVLTELIDFFPGRIERDDWIGQAESLKQYH